MKREFTPASLVAGTIRDWQQYKLDVVVALVQNRERVVRVLSMRDARAGAAFFLLFSTLY